MHQSIVYENGEIWVKDLDGSMTSVTESAIESVAQWLDRHVTSHEEGSGFPCNNGALVFLRIPKEGE